MKRKEICQKCGKEKIVRDHHLNGYEKLHKDEVAPYCYSCDLKAHNNARKEGRCTLTSKEIQRLSMNSSMRRAHRHFSLSSKTLAANVQLRELLDLNVNTGLICINTYFSAYNGKKLKYIDVT